MFSPAQEQTDKERRWQKSSVETTELALEACELEVPPVPSAANTVGEEAK